MANFNGLTFAVVPVVLASATFGQQGVLNTAGLPAGTVVAGVLDPANGVHRLFNPQLNGNAVVSGDAYTKWLPVIAAAGLTATSIQDNYWTPATGSAGATKLGQISLPLVPAAADVVNSSSTLVNTKVSPSAFVITCTAGSF